MDENFPSVPNKLMNPQGMRGARITENQPIARPDVVSRPDLGEIGRGGFNRKGFVKAYADLVARTWVDESYLERLVEDPVTVLTKAGIPTPEGAVIRVVQHKITGAGKIDDQIDAWLNGGRTGLFDLYVPMRPEEIDPSVIDIGGLGGPRGPGGLAADNCCCCSPCCCCT